MNDIKTIPGVTTQQALETASKFQFTPMDNGGILIECTAGLTELEIDIDPNGVIAGVSFFPHRD